jgi:branched-subunit amino acid transport protein
MSHSSYDVWAVVVMTVCAFITRAGYMLVGSYLPLPDGVRRALRYAPLAALTAIIVTDMLPWHPGVGPVFDFKLLAGVAGTLVFLRTRSSTLVIVSGMIVLWLLRWIA